ncbi:unnamed protein product, partial [Enterobius vermicularis]|uniref:Phage portal protein n=1 Tax=Enterobius vermicularis TaxID=51028 RepID=A0A0N4VQH2_ENTVE
AIEEYKNYVTGTRGRESLTYIFIPPPKDDVEGDYEEELKAVVKSLNEVQKEETNKEDSSWSKATVVAPDEQTRKAIQNVTESNSTKIFSFDDDKPIEDQLDDLVNKTIDNVGKFYKYLLNATN